ncbi:MAG: SGNH/GDSL hydrolase family protein [Lachnospiraceae bacterium]|nr:SGNH/GDSL hydrolase family protein [Lachnospiraceae bacterium]
MKKSILLLLSLVLCLGLFACAGEGAPKETVPGTEPGTEPPATDPDTVPPETKPLSKFTNLYDASSAQTGWVNGSGTESPDGSFYTSDFIETYDGDTVTSGPAVPGQGWHLVLFAENKQAIGDGTTANGVRILEDFDGTASIMEYSVKKTDVAFVRFVSDRRYHDSYLVTLDDPFNSDDLAEYCGMTRPVLETFAREANSPLEGMRVLFLGDSLGAGQWDDGRVRAWAGRIAEQFGTISDNQAIGGYCFSNIRGSGPMILNQLNKVRRNEYDMVILEGGVNDAWGTVDGTNKVAPVGEMSDSFDPDDFDVSTFAGGFEKTLSMVFDYYGDATVGYIAVFNMKAATGIGKVTEMEPYYDMAKKICEKWDVAYLDMYHDDYVNDELMAVTTSKYLKDPVHPNKEGYDRISPYIGKWMETLVG